MLRCSAISDCTPRPWDHIRGLRMSFRSPDNKIAGARVRGTVARHRKSECKKICSNQGYRGAEDPPTAHRHQHRHHPMPANLLGSDQKKSARHPPGTGWTAACARRSVTAGAHQQPRQCSTKGRGGGWVRATKGRPRCRQPRRCCGRAPCPPTSRDRQRENKKLPSGRMNFRWIYKSNGARLNLNGSSQRGDSAAYNTLSRV